MKKLGKLFGMDCLNTLFVFGSVDDSKVPRLPWCYSANLSILLEGLLKLSATAFLLVLVCLLYACEPTPKRKSLSTDAIVLAFGDSLTAGYGAAQGASYPSRLAQLTPWQVINGGVSGDTSAQALKRLPTLINQHQPQLIIISIGGNDFLQQLDEQQTRNNINTIIDLAQENQIDIALIGVPYYSLRAALGLPKDHPLYQDIANQRNIPLLSGAWGDILKNDALKSDQIHPNARGYTAFTETLLAFLEAEGWLP